MKTTANKIEINYELSGKGECFVLIHGYSDNLNMWYNQVPEFEKEYQVIAYDVRGFGKSDVIGVPYSIDIFADDLYELLKVLGVESAYLMGYSMGGRIALHFAIKHPEMTKALIFANSAISSQPDPDAEERRRMMLEVMQKSDIEAIAEMMAVASFSPGFKEKDPATFQKYKDLKMQNDPSPYVAIMEAMAEASAAPPDLGQLRCPVLIIAGEQDGFMPLDIAESMKKSISNVSMKVFPTGHAAALEVPAEFNRTVLDFLKGL